MDTLKAQSAIIDDKTVLKKGWIFKKSKHIKNYRKRFMQLQGMKLCCYKTRKFQQTKEAATEIFDLEKHEYRININEKVLSKFYLVNDTLSISRTFKALSENDRNDWIYYIRDSILSGKLKRERSFDQLYRSSNSVSHNTNSQTRSRPMSISPTFESEIKQNSLNDSESEEEDMAFGGYIISIINEDEAKNNEQNQQNRQRTGSKASIRKQNTIVTADSFRNFRVQTLSIDSDVLQTIPDFNDDYDDDDSVDNLETLVEEKEDFSDEDSSDIMLQLEVFGYAQDDINKAMEIVVNPKDINEIKDKLEQMKNEQMEKEKAEKEEKEKEDKKREEELKKIMFIEQEIIASEQTYCDGLYTLLYELIEPMFSNGYIDKKYQAQILSSIPLILEFHNLFLTKLKQKPKEKRLVTVFNEFMAERKDKFIEINMEYIKDYQTICGLFGCEFHGNEALDAFLKEKRSQMKPLSSLLMLPIQRVPRYSKLMIHLRANVDIDSKIYVAVDDTVELMTGIMREINQRKNKIENVSQCLQIQKSLSGLVSPIVKEDRMFIDQFVFIKQDIKHQRLFFLFNDILIIANEKWKVKHILKVITLDVKDIKMNEENSIQVNKKKQGLAEFKLVSVGNGNALYYAKNMEQVNKFSKLVGKWRIETTKKDLRARTGTLGTVIKKEFGRQSQLFETLPKKPKVIKKSKSAMF